MAFLFFEAYAWKNKILRMELHFLVCQCNCIDEIRIVVDYQKLHKETKNGGSLPIKNVSNNQRSKLMGEVCRAITIQSICIIKDKFIQKVETSLDIG
jgi:hypothetical protein